MDIAASSLITVCTCLLIILKWCFSTACSQFYLPQHYSTQRCHCHGQVIPFLHPKWFHFKYYLTGCYNDVAGSECFTWHINHILTTNAAGDLIVTTSIISRMSISKEKLNLWLLVRRLEPMNQFWPRSLTASSSFSLICAIDFTTVSFLCLCKSLRLKLVNCSHSTNQTVITGILPAFTSNGWAANLSCGLNSWKTASCGKTGGLCLSARESVHVCEYIWYSLYKV